MTEQCRHQASIIFAVLAAALWFASALIPIPKEFSVVIASTQSALGGGPLGGGSGYHGYSPDIEKMGKGLRLQSRLSAAAAVCAGLSALFQI